MPTIPVDLYSASDIVGFTLGVIALMQASVWFKGRERGILWFAAAAALTEEVCNPWRLQTSCPEPLKTVKAVARRLRVDSLKFAAPKRSFIPNLSIARNVPRTDIGMSSLK